MEKHEILEEQITNIRKFLPAKPNLANVIISPNCEIEEGVKIGTGVCFTNNDLIPKGLDLTIALLTTQEGKIDFNTDVVINSSGILKQIIRPARNARK